MALNADQLKQLEVIKVKLEQSDSRIDQIIGEIERQQRYISRHNKTPS